MYASNCFRNSIVVGLRRFLHTRKVPGFDSPTCESGEGDEDVQHLLECVRFRQEQSDLVRITGTTALGELLKENKWAKQLVRWVMGLGLLEQYKGVARDWMEAEVGRDGVG